MTEERESFEQIYKAAAASLKTWFEPGEQVSGRVLAVTRDAVYLDINAKNDASISRQELEEDGELTVKKGDRIQAYYVGMQSDVHLLTLALEGTALDDQSLQEAYAAQLPIQGKIEEERKGGFAVKIAGQRAFCPYSQIDIHFTEDKTVYVGQRLTFLIVEYGGGNLVVSRRRLQEQELEKNREHLKETLQEGAVVSGTVTRLMDFGVFVDIGGVEGLIHMRDPSWSRVKSAAEVVSVGEHVSVRVDSVDWDNEKFGLSLRKTGDDPWGTVSDRFHITGRYPGIVRHLKEFGAFVELEPGIDGLLHISKLGAGKRLSHPGEVLKEDQAIDVYIEAIDLESRRISLALENPQEGRSIEVDGQKLTVGEPITGTVDGIKPYGLFVRLKAGQSGLLHISEIPFEGAVDRQKDLTKRYPAGSEITVVVRTVEKGKISLALPDREGEVHTEMMNDEGSDDLGNLGGLFDDVEL